MLNVLYDAGRNGFLTGDIHWLTDTIKCVLVDMDIYGLQITGIADNGAGLIRCTSAAHGLTNGDRILQRGVQGTTEANGVWYIEGVTTDTFDLTGSVFTNTYTSGGQVVLLSSSTASLADILATARVATQPIANPLAVAGVADADNLVFPTVTGASVEGIVLYKDTGTESTSTLIAIICDANELPITPSGANITVAWDDGINKIFKL